MIGAHIGTNRLCVVDCETTPHEIWQFTAIPSDNDFNPIQPFLKLTIRPSNLDKCDRQIMRMSKDEFTKLKACPVDHEQAREMFDTWWERLHNENVIGYGSRLLPIAQNSPFDRFMVGQWLGTERMEECFHPWHRCPMSLAQMLNDMNFLRNPTAPPLYPLANLKVLAAKFGIENKKAHDATEDCLTTLEVYKRMIHQHAEIV